MSNKRFAKRLSERGSLVERFVARKLLDDVKKDRRLRRELEEGLLKNVSELLHELPKLEMCKESMMVVEGYLREIKSDMELRNKTKAEIKSTLKELRGFLRTGTFKMSITERTNGQHLRVQ